MQNKKQHHKGQIIGEWTLEKKIGSGGNGDVWRVNNIFGEKYAMKILKKNKNTPLIRFKDEIEIMKKFNNVKGILTIIDSSISEDISTNSWFVMELAVPINLNNASFQDIVNGIIEVTYTLEALHIKEYSHRDIKPANILYCNGQYCLSDYGLAHYPEKMDVTKLVTGSVGPTWTIAPEMRRNPSESDGKKADIYSLAKTLWILLTKQEKGYEGQYSKTSISSLRNYVHQDYIMPLEELMIDSTNENPNERPDIIEFRRLLLEWLKDNSIFPNQNHKEWIDIQTRLFPNGIPRYVEWTDLNSIVSVLNEVAKTDSSNHIFLPSGGGQDLKKVFKSTEKGLIELDVANRKMIVKPIKLIYEGFNNNIKWNYFRIITDKFSSCGFVDSVAEIDYYPEDVAKVDSTFYHESKIHDMLEEDNDYYFDGVFQSRFFQGGDFILVQKTSPYNLAGSTYDARHAKMSSQEFRKYMESCISRNDI